MLLTGSANRLRRPKLAVDQDHQSRRHKCIRKEGHDDREAAQQPEVEKAAHRGGVLGVRFVSTDEDEISPWLYSPSGRKPEITIKGPLPDKVDLVLGNEIYISKEGLPPSLKNRLIRLAAFQNPEFYKAQAMRFPTYDKPRIVLASL